MWPSTCTRVWFEMTAAVILFTATLIAAVAFPSVASAAPSYKGFPEGYCTYYAAQEFDKVASGSGLNWNGDAGQWYSRAQLKGWAVTKDADKATNGAVAVWGNGRYGHVAVVRKVTKDAVMIEEMNYGSMVNAEEAITKGFNKVSSREIRRSALAEDSTFKGFVLPVTVVEQAAADAERELQEAADAAAKKAREEAEKKAAEVADHMAQRAEEEVVSACGGGIAAIGLPLLLVGVVARRKR